jgi:hypothetical protein
LKINHRNEDVRAKAETLISRIKGYRARGRLTAGVPLRKPISTIRLLAAEPRMDDSLSWLVPTSRDDQFIASTVETIRQHPRSAVTIVTRDINLQNKAELARLPFVEPPDPPPAPVKGKPSRPRDLQFDIRIFELKPKGGAPGNVNFSAEIQNYGTKPVRVNLTAAVDDQPVELRPGTINLLVNAEPTQVGIAVPRPDLGDLVPEFNNETTLYGQELTLEIRVDDLSVAHEGWREIRLRHRRELRTSPHSAASLADRPRRRNRTGSKD